jgi:hypothetical protein
MPKTSQKNRRSPSGPIADAQLPIFGSNLLTTASTHYLAVGSLGDSATENVGQVGIAEPGKLRRLVVQNVVPGVAPSFAITYNVRKNGVLIPGATAATTNIATDPVEIDINTDVTGPDVGVTQDLISVQVVVAAFGGGTSPVVRAELLWAPGANF